MIPRKPGARSWQDFMDDRTLQRTPDQQTCREQRHHREVGVSVAGKEGFFGAQRDPGDATGRCGPKAEQSKPVQHATRTAHIDEESDERNREADRDLDLDVRHPAGPDERQNQHDAEERPQIERRSIAGAEIEEMEREMRSSHMRDTSEFRRELYGDISPRTTPQRYRGRPHRPVLPSSLTTDHMSSPDPRLSDGRRAVVQPSALAKAHPACPSVPATLPEDHREATQLPAGVRKEREALDTRSRASGGMKRQRRICGQTRYASAPKASAAASFIVIHPSSERTPRPVSQSIPIRTRPCAPSCPTAQRTALPSAVFAR
jgi:hypothetical protein